MDQTQTSQHTNIRSKRFVSVVMAGYNEEQLATSSMSAVYAALEGSFEKFELILVDDASKDNTLALMEEFERTHEHVIVLKNNVNLNFGTAVLRGLVEASGEYVIYQAFDLVLGLKDMVRLPQETDDDVDVLVLERKGYKPTRWRRITSKVNEFLLKALFPRLTRGTPILNYVQMFRREIIPQIIPLARSPIFVWPELIFRAKLAELNVQNVPVLFNMENKRNGSFGHPHDIIWGIYDMLRFRIRLWCKTY